jgi:hypothetical protein
LSRDNYMSYAAFRVRVHNRKRDDSIGRYAALAFFLLCASLHAASAVEFARDIQPLLAGKCFPCHSGTRVSGGIRFDVRAGAFAKGSSGTPAIVPGDSPASELIRRVSSPDKKRRMPLGGEPLRTEQIALLRAWIDAGANWPDSGVKIDTPPRHWAFQPLKVTEPPHVQTANWPKTPVDHFILAALESKGLSPAPQLTGHSLSAARTST